MFERKYYQKTENLKKSMEVLSKFVIYVWKYYEK